MNAFPSGAPFRPRTRFGVYGLAVRDGSVLLARISPLIPAGAGRWTLPGGGIQWGEDPRAALAREMWEETGMSPAIGEPLDLRSRVVDYEGSEIHLIQAVYQVEVDGSPTVTEQGGTVDQSAWHPIDSVPSLPTTTLVDWVEGRLR